MRRTWTLLLFVCAIPAFADITISTVTPAAGLTSGGTIVHLHGTNLFGPALGCAALGCSVYVQFGDTLGTVIYDSADEIIAVAPQHVAGPVDLFVNVPLNPTLTLKNAFAYQDPKSDTVRVLLPIAAGTQGIFNTTWQTDVLAHNEMASPVVIAGTTVPPLSTQKLTLSPSSTGMFLTIPRSVFEGVTITTHVHDKTHDAENLGVDVPSIPETQFRRSVVLTGVPNDSRYRVLLRVYGYPGNYQTIVRVRDDSTGALLATQNFTLTASDLAYLQMPVTAAPSSPVLRVEVTTGAPTDPPIWAFLTLTNNTTENVTTITPNVAVTPTSSASVLTAGRWAHNGYCMTVSPLGDASVSVALQCGGGGSFSPPSIDGDGHFEVDGTFTYGSGACCPSPEPAHYSGLVTNGTVVLTIRTQFQTIGPFTLVYGSTEPCWYGTCP